MSRGRNPGKVVELEDGRIGIVYNSEAKLINGKLPVHTYDKITQADLFNPQSDLSEMKNALGKKILVDPKKLKHIGFTD
jgi:hypothetical protein